jgi:transposase, IS30 family
LTREERIVIERMSRGGRPPRDIAEVLGRHVRTVQRELMRGRVRHLDSDLREKMVYSSDRGQDIHDLNATAKGPELKLGANHQLVEFVRERILKHKEAPDVVAFRMKKEGLLCAVCTKTLYNYIEQGLIRGVSNESLWEKRQRRRRARRVLRHTSKLPTRRQSIEVRPEAVNTREEFGHWEIDLIVGPSASKSSLMSLVERKTRKVILRKLPDKTHKAIRKAINGIERSFGALTFRQMFRSITADNGSEFLDVDGMQTSIFSSRRRTNMFYAHPYAAWERGSNENTNRIIRRFIVKGRSIKTITRQTIRTVEQWINEYPRRIIEFNSPNQAFQRELKALVA